MISKQDILDRAAEWQLRPDVVEKDYALGWFLVALASHLETRALWIFKGGTCIKKCYFETYRFSEDLDFSLLPDAPYSEAAIRERLRVLSRMSSELSGIFFPEDLVEVRVRQDKLGRPTFQGRISYRGPLDIPTFPRILFDITQHEPVLDVPSPRAVFHPYPDADAVADGLSVLAYSLDELLAEKTRALYERTRPRDLYDVVHMLENQPEAFSFEHAHELFRKKCAAKNLDVPSAVDFIRVVQGTDELRAEWENMLAHQLPHLPVMDDLVHRLSDLVRWIDLPAAVVPKTQLARVSISAEESVVAPAGMQYWGAGTPLEAVRFAGTNRLLVEFVYDGRQRLVEPYSLRRAGTGNLLLYGWEQGSTHIKAFNTPKMYDVRATKITFQPRYRIEFTPEGPLRVRSSEPLGRRRLYPTYEPRRPSRRSGARHGVTYTFECPHCRKRFRRVKNDPRLSKHKVKGGSWNCPGRRGYLVSVQ